jgi:hypothetical protein
VYGAHRAAPEFRDDDVTPELILRQAEIPRR